MEVIESIKEKSEVIAISLVTYQFQLRPDEWSRYGKKGIEASLRDARYLLDYLYEAILANEPQILISYALWADELFKGLKLPENTMLETLECLKVTIAKEYDYLQSITNPYIEQAIDALRQNQKLTQPELSNSMLSMQAKVYIDMLLNGDRHEALKLIEQLSNQGVSVKDI
jgi:hypothetical protein